MNSGTDSKRMWYGYDGEADVLYLNFKKSSHADDSELTDDDMIIRYEGGGAVGVTVLNARKRGATAKPAQPLERKRSPKA